MAPECRGLEGAAPRGDVDDPRVRARAQERQHRLRHTDDPGDIDIEGIENRGDTQIAGSLAIVPRKNPGVVDQHVERPGPRRKRPPQGGDARVVAHLHGQHLDPILEFPCECMQFLCLGRTPAGGEYAPAPPRELLGKTEADTPVGAGDQDSAGGAHGHPGRKDPATEGGS